MKKFLCLIALLSCIALTSQAMLLPEGRTKEESLLSLPSDEFGRKMKEMAAQRAEMHKALPDAYRLMKEYVETDAADTQELIRFEKESNTVFPKLQLKDLSTPSGRTILHTLAETNNSRQINTIFKLLQQGLADLTQLANMADAQGNTPLHSAALLDNELLAQLLLSADSKVNARNNQGETPLHLAAKHDRESIVKELIDQGADLCAETDKGETPLMVSLQYFTQTTSYLLSQKKLTRCINVQDEQGNTALHLAIANRPAIDIIDRLLKLEADTSIKNKEGQTPLELAEHLAQEATDPQEKKVRQELLTWLLERVNQ